MIETKQKEYISFLKKNPDIDAVDLLIADLNGVIRGKRIASKALENVYKNGVYFTTSLFA